jgi:putative alpha-1,2-mannosidase
MNGKTMERPFFNHDEILQGGTIEFEMGPLENKQLFN